jgi:hypothetical protein
MATHRLPIPGSDNGTWGDILNDFLVQAHNSDGSLQDGIITDAKVASSAAIAKTKLAPGVQTSLTAADNAAPKPVSGTDGKVVQWNNTSGQLVDATTTLNATYVSQSTLAAGSLPGRLTTLGVGNFVPSARNQFGVGLTIDASYGPTTNDYLGLYSQVVFTGDYTGTTAPDNGFFFGSNDYYSTGKTAGDGNAIASLTGKLVEIDIQTPPSAFPSAAPFSGRFNIQSAVALEAETSFAASSAGNVVYSVTSMRVNAPKYKGGAVATRAIADGVLNTDTSLVSATAAFVSGDVGARVVGNGIPYGTTIASVTNGTTVVLSAPTTATATGVSVAIGNGASVLAQVYGLYVEPVAGRQVGSTNTFSIYSAGGNHVFNGPVSMDLTQMTDLGYGSGMPVRAGAIPAINIKVPNGTYNGRLIDIWGTSPSGFQLFNVTGGGNVQAASQVLANLNATGQARLGLLTISSTNYAGVALGSSAGLDSNFYRIAANVFGMSGPLFLASSSAPPTVSGSGGLYVNSGDGTLHYINPSGVDAALASASGPSASDRQIVISAFGTPQATTANAWSVVLSTGAYNNGIVTNATSPAINDSITFWAVWLDVGTWQLDALALSATDGGQASAALVGGSTINFSGTQEQYATSSAALRTTFAGVSVTTAGLYAVKLTMAAKNASSSGYRCRCSGAILTRTA